MSDRIRDAMENLKSEITVVGAGLVDRCIQLYEENKPTREECINAFEKIRPMSEAIKELGPLRKEKVKKYHWAYVYRDAIKWCSGVTCVEELTEKEFLEYAEKSRYKRDKRFQYWKVEGSEVEE
jgi:hypothetical protein